MEIYIHFGIYKTGSSFLQYICANQREELEQQGVYFSASTEDAKMKQGSISKGNAGNLEYLLWTNNVRAAASLLEKWKEAATSSSCDRVLISAEALVHQIALQRPLATLIESAYLAGFEAIHAIGFFRPLVDHALSTYKHRAKSGRHQDIRAWIEKTYETPVLLERLLNRLQEQPDINFVLRSFRKDGAWMKQAFFQDWLGVELSAFDGNVEVNTSLSLSEIKILQGLKAVYPLTLDILVRRLLVVPNKHKAKDTGLEAYTKAVFYEELKQNKDLLDKLSLFFKEGERVDFGYSSTSSQSEGSNALIQLSPEQWQAIQNGMAFLSSTSGAKVHWRRMLFLVIKLLKLPISRKQEVSLSLDLIYPKGAKSKISNGQTSK